MGRAPPFWTMRSGRALAAIPPACRGHGPASSGAYLAATLGLGIFRAEKELAHRLRPGMMRQQYRRDSLQDIRAAVERADGGQRAAWTSHDRPGPTLVARRRVSTVATAVCRA